MSHEKITDMGDCETVVAHLEEQNAHLEEENQHLREASAVFGDLAERLSTALKSERQGVSHDEPVTE